MIHPLLAAEAGASGDHTALWMFLAFVAATLVITFLSEKNRPGPAPISPPDAGSPAGRMALPSPVTT